MFQKLSFVIPALNEQDSIDKTISSIKSSLDATGYPGEIIVIDHNSRDRTAEIAEKLRATVIRHTGGTVATLRNIGARRATGNILIFIDADVTVTDEWARNIPRVINELSENKKVITGSHCSPPDGENVFHRYWFSSLARDPRDTHLGTGHMMLSAQNFETIGGFNESLATGEDYDFCQRATILGFEIKNDPSLRVIHEGFPTTIKEFIKREKWHGQGDAESFRNAIKSKVVIGSAFFIFLHLTLFLGFITQSGPVISASLLAIVALLTLSSTIKNRHESIRIIVFNALIFYLYYIGRSASLFSALGKILKRANPVGKNK